MAAKGSLHDAFLIELRDVYHAERQVLKALPKWIKATRTTALRDAFASHLEETKAQIQRVEQAFASVGVKVRAKKCDGMAGILEESRSLRKEDLDAPTMDACLVAVAQRVEHYEIAAYGTLVAWATARGHGEAAGLLSANLAEEQAAASKLAALAEQGLTALSTPVAGKAEPPQHPSQQEPVVKSKKPKKKKS